MHVKLKMYQLNLCAKRMMMNTLVRKILAIIFLKILKIEENGVFYYEKIREYVNTEKIQNFIRRAFAYS